MANNNTDVRLTRSQVKRKLEDEELPSTSKILNMQDKQDEYSKTFQRASDLLTKLQENKKYMPQPELWTVFSRSNFTSSSWYSVLPYCSPELPICKPWLPPPNASPQKSNKNKKKVPSRLWRKQGTVQTKRGMVSHWELVQPGPPEEFDYFTALAETLPPLPSERLYLILNLAAFATARERLAMGFASLHHALQPCSVCERLLAIKVDAQGEIESSGTCYGNQCYYRGYCDCTRQVQLALHGPHWHPHVIHPSCHEHQI